MRVGRASRTAMVVALWRAFGDFGLSSVPRFSDPQAALLLDGPFWRYWLKWGKGLAARPTATASGFRPHLDVIILRVAFIDAVIAETRAAQVVILGAGLDTRAWRLHALREARVFEVDHPATQAYKRTHASRLGPPLTDLRFVPVDFERTHASDASELERALEAAGHDATMSTLWIWEGVIMYLDDAALRGTLGAIRRRSAAGSRLVAHYHEPDALPRMRPVRKLVFSLLGEPQIGIRTQATMQAELTRAGFEPIEDADLAAQATRVGAPAPTSVRGLISRMLVARPQPMAAAVPSHNSGQE